MGVGVTRYFPLLHGLTLQAAILMGDGYFCEGVIPICFLQPSKQLEQWAQTSASGSFEPSLVFFWSRLSCHWRSLDPLAIGWDSLKQPEAALGPVQMAPVIVALVHFMFVGDLIDFLHCEYKTG